MRKEAIEKIDGATRVGDFAQRGPCWGPKECKPACFGGRHTDRIKPSFPIWLAKYRERNSRQEGKKEQNGNSKHAHVDAKAGNAKSTKSGKWET